MVYRDPYEALGIAPEVAESARLLPVDELAQAAGARLLRTEGTLPTTGRGPDFGTVVPGVIEGFLTEPQAGALVTDEATAHRIAAAERLVEPLGLRVVAEMGDENEETVAGDPSASGTVWPPIAACDHAAHLMTHELIAALTEVSGSRITGSFVVRAELMHFTFGALLDRAAHEKDPLPKNPDLDPETVEAHAISREHMARLDAARLDFAARVARALGHRQVPGMKIDESVTDLEPSTLASAFVTSHAEAHNAAASTAVDAEELLTNILTSPRALTAREKVIAYEVGLRLIDQATRPDSGNTGVEGQ